MTTIACDGKTIAADSQITGCGLIHSNTFQKIHRLPDGSIFAFSGAAYDLQAWLDFASGLSCELRAIEDSEALVLKPNGELWCYNEIGRAYRQSVPAATGSGSAVALGAMLAGASPRRAVEIASMLDTKTGGDVIEMAPSLPDHMTPKDFAKEVNR